MDIQELMNFDQCVAEVVSVSIGVNLLLPAASKILKPLADAFDASPQRAILKFFRKDREYCSDYDLQAFGICQQIIDEDKKKYTINRLRWQLLELVFAVAGILLLWTGLAKKLGWMSILLFIPAAIVCCVSAWIFLSWTLRVFVTILCVKWFVRMRRELADRANTVRGKTMKDMEVLNSLGSSLEAAGIPLLNAHVKPTASTQASAPCPQTDNGG